MPKLSKDVSKRFDDEFPAQSKEVKVDGARVKYKAVEAYSFDIKRFIADELERQKKELIEKFRQIVDEYAALGMCADNCEGALNLQENITEGIQELDQAIETIKDI